MNSTPTTRFRGAFVTSHPIQYQVPVFRELAKSTSVDLTVAFAMLPDAVTQGAGFAQGFSWDIPLLDGYKYHVLKNKSPNPSVTQFRGCDTPDIGKWLKANQFDAVIVNGWVVKTCLQALAAAKRLRIPCLVRGEANHLRPRPWWKKYLQRQLVRRFDAFLPIGKANRAFYQAYGVRAEQLFDAPYCIDNERFGATAELHRVDRPALRKRWGIPQAATCLLYCGKFEAKKHPMELLIALRQAIEQLPDKHLIFLLMVGDGALREACQQYVQMHELPVSFVGFLNQSEIPAAYVAADCLVLPSDFGETWGLVVNESFACGTPAIVSSLVGCREDLIKEGETGWSFPFGDWQALSERIRSLALDPSQLPRMSMLCKTRIAAYSPAAAACGIEAGIKHVHEKRRAGKQL